MSSTLSRPRRASRDAEPTAVDRALGSASRVAGRAGEGARRFVVTGVGPAAGRIARPLRIASPLGWGVVGTGVLALVVALWLGWAEMLAVAVVAAASLVFAVPFVLGRADYHVSVELASPRVTVGERAVGRVVVRNIARRSSPRTRITFPVGRARAEFGMPRLAPDAEHDELFTIPTQRRAVLTLGPVTSVRSDPLGLLRREVSWTEPTDLFVHPKVVQLASETAGIQRDLEGLPTRDLADDDVSFHALREYSPGDDLRHVHWKSTARTQSMMIRQFEQTRRSHLVILLATRDDEYADDDEFELAVSSVGSIGLTALRGGKTVSVLTGAGLLASPTVSTLLDGLAGVEATRSTPDIAAVARTVATRASGASVVAFVTGSATPLPAIRAASLRVPSTARSVCVRATSSGTLARRVIGDVSGVDVPALADLRMAMRAVSA